MNQELTKETVQKLMEIEGRVRGVAFKTDREFILKEKGEEGLKKLEEALEQLGYPIKFEEVKTMDFYPGGLRVLCLLVIKKVFNFDDEKIKEMGFFAAKASFIIRLFVKYFFSTKKVFYEKSLKIWKKQWDFGEFVPVELDEEKKYAILRIKNFNLHFIYCLYLKGYLSGILTMLVKASKITCEETRCPFKGDEYHEYLLKWE